MNLSNDTKTILIIVLVIGAIYMFCNMSKSNTNQNEGMLTQDKLIKSGGNVNVDSDSDKSLPLSDECDNDAEDSDGSQSAAQLKSKMTSSNTARGQYKQSSYAAGNRLSTSANLDKFFEGNGPQDPNANSGFAPVDESNGTNASYIPTTKTGRKKLSEKEKFDAVGLLPSEKNADWFDDPYAATTVKSSHLINLTRPVGVNTISTTLKNPSHDIRGTPPNPKYPVSPWSNSSFEPDTNLRNQALCY